MRFNKNIIKGGPASRGGFTMVELILTITIAGILAGAVAVSWSSFTKHQNMRQAAGNLHKEILAAKATALANDTIVQIRYATGTNRCTLRTFVDNGSGTLVARNKPINLHPSVSIVVDSGWGSPITIYGTKNKVDPYTNGRILITQGGTNKKKYRIRKVSGDIKPQLQYTTDNGVTWK